MLFSFRDLKIGVFKESDGTLSSPATGETKVLAMRSDDVLLGNVGEEDEVSLINDTVLGIKSLKQLTKKFRGYIWFARFVAAFLWAIFVFYLHLVVTRAIQNNGLSWLDIIPVALIALGALLFSPQAINPVVKDLNGKWVNLQTGVTNLNGGGVIK